MTASELLRDARRRAGLSQRALAGRAGTSQPTVSAYESGRKEPSVETLSRLLAAAGARLALEPARAAAVPPSEPRLRRAGRILEQVIELAEELPSRHDAELGFPRLPTRSGGAR